MTTNPFWPLPQPDSLGQLIGADDVRNAVKNTITEFSPYYLAIVSQRLVDEGRLGAPGQDPAPLNNFGTWINEPSWRSLGTGMPAAFLVTSSSTTEPPTLQGNRQYRATWRAQVVICIFGTTWEQCADRTSWYEKAVRLCIINQRSLGGLANSTKWLGNKYEPIAHESNRVLGQCTMQFDVGIANAAEIRGPAVLPTGPGAPEQDPTVATTEVTLELVSDTDALEAEED